MLFGEEAVAKPEPKPAPQSEPTPEPAAAEPEPVASEHRWDESTFVSEPITEAPESEKVRPWNAASSWEPEPEPEDDGLVRKVTTHTFESEVLRSDLPVIVDFWAPWCQPCLMVAPIVEQIAAMRAGSYRVVKVNIDEEPAIARAYEVQSIPMIALFRGGRLERASLGAKPRPALEAELGMLVIP